MTIANILLVATVWSYWNHEPADHLRRMSYSAPSVFTLGEWLPEWYERLHGEELIGKAASLGVDTVYCHFFKGFGLKHEHDEMERTREFAKIAHSRGVKVLGYCQMNSLYYEAMLGEIPDLEKWTRRNGDGSIAVYTSNYYRWSPCVESREYTDYMKKVVRYGIEHVGLDGFHFDNSYARDCHCERCQKAFRAWLAENVQNPRETCGLADFSYVRIPPKPEIAEPQLELHDPLHLWRQKFRHAQIARFHKEIFDYVKSFGPDKLVLHNPAFGRGRFDTAAVDVAVEPESCDILLAENPRFIREEAGGALVTQVAAYKLGRRLGFKVFDSTWPKVLADAEWGEPRASIPRDADSILRFYAQGMIYGDIAGCPWLVRSTKNGGGVILDDSLQAGLAGKAFKFYKVNRERLYDTVPTARTKLLYATDTFYGWSGVTAGFAAFFEATERLNREGVPYTVAMEGDIAAMTSGELLVLPDIRFLSRRLFDAIAAADGRGVKILPLGRAGRYDENGKERAKDNPIFELRQIANKVSEVPHEFKVDMSAPGIMAETQVNKRGERILHLLRPGNSSTVPSLRVVLDASVGRILALPPELFTLDDGCSLADAQRDTAGRITLTIRNFRTMCSVVLDPKGDIG